MSKVYPIFDQSIVSKINPFINGITKNSGNLFLSNLLGVEDAIKLSNKNPILVSLCEVPSEYHNISIHYLFSDVKDNNSSESTDKMNQYIIKYVPLLVEKLLDGNDIIIHCEHGISRSPTFLTAMIYQISIINNVIIKDVEEIIDHIKKYRNNKQLTDIKFNFYCLLAYYISKGKLIN
jgi:protein-tyrosine phosphatase